MISQKWVCIIFLALTTACSSGVVTEAMKASSEDRLIDNDIMSQMYPQAFRPGHPQYLERDYEAGADFICDQIKLKYRRDICSEPQVNWRR
jgi:hypothetical protein